MSKWRTLIICTTLNGVNFCLYLNLGIIHLYLLTTATSISVRKVLQYWSQPVIKYFKASECREKLFGNLLIKVVSVVLASAVNVSCLVFVGRWRLVAIATYVNVYLKLRNIAAKELVKYFFNIHSHYRQIAYTEHHWHRAHAIWCLPKMEKLGYWSVDNFLLQ